MSGRQSVARQLRRDLRRHGCTCHPTITHVPPNTPRPSGATAGGFVRHQSGCRLGDRVVDLNRRGIAPAIIVQGCSR